MSENKITFYHPFGPCIAKIKIPDKIVNDINNYIDEVSSDEIKSKKLSHGKKLAGMVRQEIRIEKEMLIKTGWASFLGNASKIFIERITQKKVSKFNILDTWVVRQFENEYNPVHWHGGHISGAGFLKVPSSFGKSLQNDKPATANLNGKLELISGNRAFMSNSTFTVKPEVGDFYIFPHYLMHTVYPFTGNNEERRSISFNALIDKKIFDVFGS